MRNENLNKERCKSGLIGSPGKTVCLYGYRGFESHPLRQLEFVKEFDASRLAFARRSATSLYSFLAEKEN